LIQGVLHGNFPRHETAVFPIHETKIIMKKNCIITALMLFTAVCVSAQETSSGTNTNTMPITQQSSMSDDFAGHLSAGLIIGEPTGASLKYWLNDVMAVDGALGWSSRRHSDLYMHGDVLWHNFDLIPVSQGKLPVYFGVGGLVRFRHDGYGNDAGVRFPVGISYMFDNVPVEIFAEIGPAIDVAPDLHGEVTGGVGARFRF
jgi:hypothetical protein